MAKKRCREPENEQMIQSELFTNDKTTLNFRIKSLKFKNDKQRDFFNLCKDPKNKMIICDGVAGTGKTLISFYVALKLVKTKKYDQILYVRSPVDSSERGIGFLPGDLYDKVNSYMLPMEEKLEKLLDFDKIKELKNNNIVESTVNTFMRGRSIDNTIVIIDEIQNYTFEESKTILSRFEENTKLIVLGDHTQSDIGLKSCLTKLTTIFDDNDCADNGVVTFSFGVEDVVRSGLTKFILEKFEKYGKLNRG